jgi:hypothetical protein
LESVKGGAGRVIASGLTTAEFKEASADNGETEFVVKAVNANGESANSVTATVTISKAPMPRAMVMH